MNSTFTVCGGTVCMYLANDLRWLPYEQVSSLFFPDKSGTNSSTRKVGWLASLGGKSELRTWCRIQSLRPPTATFRPFAHDLHANLLCRSWFVVIRDSRVPCFYKACEAVGSPYSFFFGHWSSKFLGEQLWCNGVFWARKALTRMLSQR